MYYKVYLRDDFIVLIYVWMMLDQVVEQEAQETPLGSLGELLDAKTNQALTKLLFGLSANQLDVERWNNQVYNVDRERESIKYKQRPYH